MSFINLSPTHLKICIFTLTILIAASITNFIFKKLKPQTSVFQKTAVIINSWWLILGTVLLFSCFGPYGFLLLFTAVNCLLIREYLINSKLTFIKKELACAFYLYAAGQVFLISQGHYELFTALPILYFVLTFPPLLYKKESLNNLPNLTAGYLCVLLLTNGLFYLPAFIFEGPSFFNNSESALLTFFIVLGLTQSNDVFQFITGKLFGRSKPVPHLSPNKTEAGFIGGILITTSLGGFLFNHFVDLPLSLSLFLGFMISIVGIFGDLTFSGLKRHFNIKDFSTAIPGHGGFMDRLDSLIFTGPLLFHILKFFMETK